jgi:pimeloyl-ACP methyl ester carboxylesterase
VTRSTEPSPTPTTWRSGLAQLEHSGTGAAALLVPGYTGSKEDFGPVLAQLGRRALAIDLPGQHESPAAASLHEYTTAALGQRVVALAEELGRDGSGPVHLVGHSFGGLVCRAAVLQRPELVGSLVLLCSGPGAIPAPRRPDIELLVDAARGCTSDELWGVLSAHWDALEAPAQSSFSAHRWQRADPVGLVGMGRAVLDEPDRVAELMATGVPVLVVTGEDDDAWPLHLQHQMATRLGTRQVLVPGAAHSPAVENPEALGEVLRTWWGSLS